MQRSPDEGDGDLRRESYTRNVCDVTNAFASRPGTGGDDAAGLPQVPQAGGGLALFVATRLDRLPVAGASLSSTGRRGGLRDGATEDERVAVTAVLCLWTDRVS